MRRDASPTDPPRAAPLGALVWLALIALALTAPALARGDRHPLRLVGCSLAAATLLLRALAPRLLAGPARVLERALVAFGDVVSDLALTGVYFVLVLPYARLLRALGRIAPPDEPWPPTEASGWTAVDDGPRRHRAAGSLLAGLAVRAGGAVALVSFLWRRPSFFLVPLVLLVLLLSAFVLLGSTTGLGPLIYTLF